MKKDRKIVRFGVFILDKKGNVLNKTPIESIPNPKYKPKKKNEKS